MKMNNFKFNFKSENQELMNELKHLQINNSDKDYQDRSKDEYNKIKDIIFANKPKNILDIGAGIGRSSVYFKNVEELNDTEFYLADFNGKEFEKKGGCGQHDNVNPIPYNSLDITKSFCENNGMNMKKTKIINLESNGLNNIGKMDIIYSFHCIGYHWSISEAFKNYKLEEHAHENTIFVFGCRNSVNISKYPKKIGKFNMVKDIPGAYLQRFLVYKKI